MDNRILEVTLKEVDHQALLSNMQDSLLALVSMLMKFDLVDLDTYKMFGSITVWDDQRHQMERFIYE